MSSNTEAFMSSSRDAFMSSCRDAFMSSCSDAFMSSCRDAFMSSRGDAFMSSLFVQNYLGYNSKKQKTSTMFKFAEKNVSAYITDILGICGFILKLITFDQQAFAEFSGDIFCTVCPRLL